jgi:hypothetical protein
MRLPVRVGNLKLQDPETETNRQAEVPRPLIWLVRKSRNTTVKRYDRLKVQILPNPIAALPCVETVRRPPQGGLGRPLVT